MSILTIGIPTYNRKDIVVTNVKKMLDNSAEDFEIVVVDNNSPDGAFEELSKIKDNRLNIFRNDENIGFQKNFYSLFDKANTPFLLTLSDEDVIDIEELKALVCEMKSKYEYYKNEIGAVTFNKKKSFEYDINNAENVFELIAENYYMSGILYNVKAFLGLGSRDINTLYPHVYCLARLFCDYKVISSDTQIYNYGVIRAQSSTVSYLHPKDRLNQLKQQVEFINENGKINYDVKIATVLKLYIRKFWSIRRYELMYRVRWMREKYKLCNLRVNYINYVKLYNEYILDIMVKYEYNNMKSLKKYITDENYLMMTTLYSMQQLENARNDGYEIVVLSGNNEDPEVLHNEIEIIETFGFKIDEVVYDITDISEKQILLKRQFNNNINYDGLIISCKEIDYAALKRNVFFISLIK